MLSCSSINVTFTKMEGAARRPMVHTCAPTLELPSTYQTFNELSEEFSSLSDWFSCFLPSFLFDGFVGGEPGGAFLWLELLFGIFADFDCSTSASPTIRSGFSVSTEFSCVSFSAWPLVFWLLWEWSIRIFLFWDWSSCPALFWDWSTGIFLLWEISTTPSLTTGRFSIGTASRSLFLIKLEMNSEISKDNWLRVVGLQKLQQPGGS